MIKPMLAVPMSKADIKDWNDWTIEEKYDGHRLIVHVDGAVKAWGRPRKHAGSDGKTMAEKILPAHLQADLLRLPAGVYDGELVGGETSTDVTRLDLQSSLRFVVFDVLEFMGRSTLRDQYRERRRLLEVASMTFTKCSVTLAEARPVRTIEDVTAFVEQVWERGGEGAILKRRSATYQPGKRSPDFVKVKKLQTTVCTVVGFEETRGTVLQRGIFATVVLEDAKGNRTSVKTKDDYELERFRKEWGPVVANIEGTLDHLNRCASTMHPAIGRKLRIEYQDWTPRGGYRHPRWDRWEAE